MLLAYWLLVVKLWPQTLPTLPGKYALALILVSCDCFRSLLPSKYTQEA